MRGSSGGSRSAAWFVGVTVVDDFAHHPTAVRETLNALRLAWPDNRLLVVFEPRTNSSRRAVFQQDYAGVFGSADEVLIREHVPLDTLPVDEQFSSVQLAADLRANGIRPRPFPIPTPSLTHWSAPARAVMWSLSSPMAALTVSTSACWSCLGKRLDSLLLVYIIFHYFRWLRAVGLSRRSSLFFPQGARL